MYLTTSEGLHILVVEPGHLAQLRDEGLVRSADGKVVLLYTPDMHWLEAEIARRGLFTRGNFDLKRFAELIEQGSQRRPVNRVLQAHCSPNMNDGRA